MLMEEAPSTVMNLMLPSLPLASAAQREQAEEGTVIWKALALLLLWMPLLA